MTAAALLQCQPSDRELYQMPCIRHQRAAQQAKRLTIKNPCIQLEDVRCRAECTELRRGCPQASDTYWREVWLKRVDTPTGSSH